ncbi:MAG TPA: hypothetical protein VFF14_01365 [Candidatus Deferrimicrobium sp.]|nr:hypothetical protein [Candidatus Deferrimicrobium sp.]
MNKYWEKEVAVTKNFGKNQIRVYAVNGKVQVYPLAPNLKYGVGSGATIDIESMSYDEAEEMLALIQVAVKTHFGR